MRRTIVLRWARLLLGVGLLVLLMTRVDLGEFAALLRKGDPLLLALGLALLFLANPVLQALRLHVLIARYTGSFATTFKLFVVGSFFNLMLPSNVGGDAVKLLYLKRMNAENWGAPFALLMLHRVTGMVSLLVAAGAYALIEHDRFVAMLQKAHVATRLPLSPKLLLAAGAVLVVLLLGWLALSPRKRAAWGEKVMRFVRECTTALARVGTGPAVLLLVLTAAFHVVRMVGFCVLVAYAREHLAFGDSLIVLAATALAGVVPLTVGGLGLMEGTVTVMLLLYGVTDSAGFAVGASNRVVLLIGAALGGIINLTFRADRAEGSALEPTVPPEVP